MFSIHNANMYLCVIGRKTLDLINASSVTFHGTKTIMIPSYWNLEDHKKKSSTREKKVKTVTTVEVLNLQQL